MFSLVFFCSCEQDSLEVRWQIIFQSSYRHVSVGLTLFLPVWTPDKLKVCGALMSALECNWVHFLLMPHCTPPLRCASEGNVVVFTSTAFISQLYSQVTSKIKIYNNFIDDQLVNTSWFQPLKWVFFQYFNNFTIFCNIDVWTVGRTKQTLWLCYFGICHHICHHFDKRWHHSRINWFPQTSLVSSHIWYWPRERRNNFKNHSLI